MPVRQNKNSKLFVIGGPYAYGEIPGVQAFGYDPQRKLERRGNNTFSGDGPVAITDSFEGVTGSFDAEGVDAEKAVLAYASRQALSTFISYHPVNNMPVYIVAKNFDDDGVTPLGCDFVDTAKIGSLKRGVITGNAQFPFEALKYKEVFDKEIIIQEFPGNATPVTVLTLSATAAALKDKSGADYYALAVLKQTSGTTVVKRLLKAAVAAAGYYSETSSAVTLAAGDGLTAADKGLVIWVKA